MNCAVVRCAYLGRVSKLTYSICCFCKLAGTEDNLGFRIPALSTVNVDQMHITKLNAFYLCIMSEHESGVLIQIQEYKSV